MSLCRVASLKDDVSRFPCCAGQRSARNAKFEAALRLRRQIIVMVTRRPGPCATHGLWVRPARGYNTACPFNGLAWRLRRSAISFVIRLPGSPRGDQLADHIAPGGIGDLPMPNVSNLL